MSFSENIFRPCFVAFAHDSSKPLLLLIWLPEVISLTFNNLHTAWKKRLVYVVPLSEFSVNVPFGFRPKTETTPSTSALAADGYTRIFTEGSKIGEVVGAAALVASRVLN